MADTYKIYQLHDTPEYHGIRFSSMEENRNENLNIKDYDLMYQGDVSDFSSDNLLEEIYRKFNLDRPENFRGHSLSVSDVVVTEINNEQKAYYCDRIGFKEMPEFFAKQNKWIDYSSNYDVKIDDEYISGLTGKENLLANGGVFFRETDHKNEFEYAAVIIEDNNTPIPCHGYVNLDDYRDDEEFIRYAEEENMTVDELINTGTFAASWVLENNIKELILNADHDKDAGQFIDDMGLLKDDSKEIPFDYEKAFAETLDSMEFSLVKYQDGSFGLRDSPGANLGNVESDRFEDATQIIERLTYATYFEDYFFDDAINDISYRQREGMLSLPDDFKMPVMAEDWVDFLEEYHLTETYSDVYQAARLLADYENVRAINLDNIPHEDSEYTKDSAQIEYE